MGFSDNGGENISCVEGCSCGRDNGDWGSVDAGGGGNGESVGASDLNGGGSVDNGAKTSKGGGGDGCDNSGTGRGNWPRSMINEIANIQAARSLCREAE